MYTRNKYRFTIFALFLFITALLISTKLTKPESSARYLDSTNIDLPSFNRNSQALDYSNVDFTPWEVIPDIETRQMKDYTVMIYLNGSDLESETGAATDDLREMIEAGAGGDNTNLVLFTGGTNRWETDVIPENSCALWEIVEGGLNKLAEIGLRSMGDAGTLTGFIDFSITNFPAEKYMLILWDHGGGSIGGYGYDEKFDSSLSLISMNYAFEASLLSETKLELLGFDSCLMSTIEMAVVASDYAEYMVASEDLEPNGGWNYQFLSVLGKDPNIDGEALGKAIVDSYVKAHGLWTDAPISLSLTRLSETSKVVSTLEALMYRCTAALEENQESAFLLLAEKRMKTHTLGDSSPRDSECDMVDIGDMVKRLGTDFPEETAQVEAALKKAVIYNRHSSSLQLSGLSTYYIYSGKEYGNEALDIYAEMQMGKAYTEYLHVFYHCLVEEPSGTEGEALLLEGTLWEKTDNGYLLRTFLDNRNNNNERDSSTALEGEYPLLDGEAVPFYPLGDDERLYAVPAKVNGCDGDIIILKESSYPKGKLLGFRREDGLVIQKGYEPIVDGDEVAFYFQRRGTSAATAETKDWQVSESHKVEGEMRLTWRKITSSDFLYSLRTTDHRGNCFLSRLS